MKVWSRTLTIQALIDAGNRVNVDFPGCCVFLDLDAISLHEGPRTRRIDGVHLRSALGRYKPNSGVYGAEIGRNLAASWTEWGWFIARVFDQDPSARVGPYKGQADFDSTTSGRFIESRTPRELQVRRAAMQRHRVDKAAANAKAVSSDARQFASRASS